MLSQENKQSGFTLIELMVVMAIIAILATAGLSAYTGYTKKARDTTRIADISAINTIVQGVISTTGLAPANGIAVQSAISEFNNGATLKDPMNNKGSVCLVTSTTYTGCSYLYKVCDGGLGYAIFGRFESVSNLPLYTQNASGPGGDVWASGGGYDVGSCQVNCSDILCPGTQLYFSYI